MQNKTTKFLLKMLMFFPFCLAFGILSRQFNFDDWIFFLIVGFMGAFGITFWQLFDYEKFNEIAYEDFLESKHSLKLENTKENWDQFYEMIKNPLLDLEIIENTENKLKVQFERKFSDSILTMNKTPDAIIVSIEKKFFSFLPDRAENYRTIQKFAKSAQKSTNIATSGV